MVHVLNRPVDAERAFSQAAARSPGDAGAEVATHRQNRVVMFNSSLFNETDRIDFKDDYVSRRINVTMLFGDRRDVVPRRRQG